MNKSFSETLQLCPELALCFEDFHNAVWQQSRVPIAILEMCRLRIAQLLSAKLDLSVRHAAAAASLSEQKISQLPVYHQSAGFSALEKACIEVAECFAMDPAAISDAMAASVIAELGDAGYVALLEACGVFDGFTRFRLLLACSALDGAYVATGNSIKPQVLTRREKATAKRPRVSALDTATGSMVRDSPLNLVPATLEAFLQFYQCLWQGRYLRPAELEVGRLRNASLVNCTFCKATRFDVARNDGLDEGRAEAALGINDSNLHGRDELIVAWTEQFLLSPSASDKALWEKMTSAFSAAECVALTAGLALFMCFSKFAVAMGGLPDSLPVMISPIPA